MTVAEVIEELKKMGDPRAIKVWANYGMPTENYLGCALTKLKKFATKLKKNHELALDLWETEYHDARLLACFIEDGDEVTMEQLEFQIGDLNFSDLARSYGQYVIAKCSYVHQVLPIFVNSSDQFIRCAAYATVGELAQKNKDMTDDFFEAWLDLIENNIHKEKNWVKDAMMYPIILIGSRSKYLNDLAIALAERIMPVEIDYGETSCQPLDLLKHLQSERVQSKLA